MILLAAQYIEKKKASGDIPQCFYMLNVAEMKDLCHAGTAFIS